MREGSIVYYSIEPLMVPSICFFRSKPLKRESEEVTGLFRQDIYTSEVRVFFPIQSPIS